MKALYSLSLLLLMLTACVPTSLEHQNAFELPRTNKVILQDAATGRSYEIHIQLPNRYVVGKKYPAVFMTDSPYTFPITTGAVRYPVNFRKMENMLFVGISWEEGHRPGLSRQRDYTPTENTPDFKDPTGQASEHLAFIKHHVITYIEENYSTDPSKRTYVGNSLGGLFGAYILLTQPDTFRNYVLGSPSFWWDDGHMLEFARGHNSFSDDNGLKVFIGIGAEETPPYNSNKYDMVGDAEIFMEILKSKNIQDSALRLHVIEHANHETAFPTTAIQGLWWLFSFSD